MALIELGMIQSSDDLPTFAQNLYACPALISAKAACSFPDYSVKKSPEEQNELLEKLDAHGTRGRGSKSETPPIRLPMAAKS